MHYSSDNPLLVYIILIVVLVIVAAITSRNVKRQKKMIHTSIESKNGKVINIEWEGPFSRDVYTYLVGYQDVNGQRVYRKCKIPIWGSSIYWEE